MRIGIESTTTVTNAESCPLIERRGKCKLLKNKTSLLRIKDGAREIQMVNQSHTEMAIGGKRLVS